MTYLANHMDDYLSMATEMYMKYYIEVKLIGALLTLPVLCLYYRNDNRRRQRLGITPEKAPRDWKRYLLIPVLAVAAAYFVNNLIVITGIYQSSGAYEAAADKFYQGRIVVELLSTGIVVPVVEEMIFRGLAYRQLKEFMPVTAAMIISALYFAFYHGNIVQGTYAMLIGLLLAYIYERYHNLLAPVFFHMAANLLAVIVTETGILDLFYGTKTIFYATTIAAGIVAAAVLWRLERLEEKEHTEMGIE